MDGRGQPPPPPPLASTQSQFGERRRRRGCAEALREAPQTVLIRKYSEWMNEASIRRLEALSEGLQEVLRRCGRVHCLARGEALEAARRTDSLFVVLAGELMLCR